MNNKSVTEQPSSGQWKYGLFTRPESLSECLCAFIPPFNHCYMYTAAKAAGEDTLCSALICFFPCGLFCVRGNVREKRGIEKCKKRDCLFTLCCSCCTAVQIKKEFTE